MVIDQCAIQVNAGLYQAMGYWKSCAAKKQLLEQWLKCVTKSFMCHTYVSYCSFHWRCHVKNHVTTESVWVNSGEYVGYVCWEGGLYISLFKTLLAMHEPTHTKEWRALIVHSTAPEDTDQLVCICCSDVSLLWYIHGDKIILLGYIPTATEWWRLDVIPVLLLLPH